MSTAKHTHSVQHTQHINSANQPYPTQHSSPQFSRKVGETITALEYKHTHTHKKTTHFITTTQKKNNNHLKAEC